MGQKRLPYKAERSTPPEGKEALDSIVIHPRSRGNLHMPGEFSAEAKHPRYKVTVLATNNDGVQWEEKLMGSRDHYVVVIEVRNFNDSPAVVHLEAISESG